PTSIPASGAAPASDSGFGASLSRPMTGMGTGPATPDRAGGTTGGAFPEHRTPSSTFGNEAAPDPNVRLHPPTRSGTRADQVAQGPRPGYDLNAGGSRPLPPVGAVATTTSPPIAVPVPPSAAAGRSTSNFVPQVESYDEETYLCKTGDTLESVCQRYYHT